MAAPPKEGATFNPAQVHQIGRAFELAAAAVAKGGGSLASIPADELRHKLACFIVHQANRGPFTAEHLASHAVEGLQVATDCIINVGRYIPSRAVARRATTTDR